MGSTVAGEVKRIGATCLRVHAGKRADPLKKSGGGGLLSVDTEPLMSDPDPGIIARDVLVLIGIMVRVIFFPVSLLYAQELTEKMLIPGKDFKVTTGNQEDVLVPYAFGLTDFPDGLMGVVRKEGTNYWFVGSFSPQDRTKTYLFRFMGPDLDYMQPDSVDSQGKAVPVLSPGPSGTYDDHIAGNGSVYFDAASGKLYFWYQAMRSIPQQVADRKVQRLGEGEVYAAYGVVGLAVSEDMGKTWSKMGTVLKSGLSWEEFLQNDSIGTADLQPPSVVRHGEFLYMYYHDFQPPDYSPWNLSLARLPLRDLEKRPQPWKKYYQGQFIGDALGGESTPIAQGTGQFDFPCVSFNTFLKQWLLVHHSYGQYLGFALRSSADGLTWSEPLVIVESVRTNDWVLHPTLIGVGDQPETIGQQFWLYHSYAPNQRAAPGGWMVRRKIKIFGKGLVLSIQ